MQKKIFVLGCLVSAVVVFGSSVEVHAATSQTVPITQWAEWGPSWGRAGLSVPRYNAEGRMAPQPGDIDNNSGGFGRGMIEWRSLTTDSSGSINFLDPVKFPRIDQSRPGSSYEWAGMVEHLHTYIKASDTLSMSGVLTAQSSPYPADLWLNDNPVTSGQTISLKPGWNRLMVKSRSPHGAEGQSWNSWSFKATVTSTASSVQLRTTDPGRLVLATDDNKAFRYLSTFVRTDGEFPVFTLGTSNSTTIVLQYMLQVGVGTSTNYQTPDDRTKTFHGYPWVYSFDPARITAHDPNSGQSWVTIPKASWTTYAPRKVKMTVRDDTGKLIRQQAYDLSYGAQIDGVIASTRQITFPSMKIGHYTVVSDLLDTTGKVLAHDNDHSFSVVKGVVDRSKDQKPRSLGVVGHWLAYKSYTSGTDLTGPRLRWMSRVGITRQQKLAEGWDPWGYITFDSSGNITIKPAAYLDSLLTTAKSLNIDVTGDAIEGYYRSAINNLDLPGNGQNMPAYGTAAWDNLFYDYGYELATKYSGRIKTWGGINEIDINGANSSSTAAAMHVAAARKISEGIKAAVPTDRYISSSLVRTSSSQSLFNAGFLTVPNLVDVHSHPWRAPEPWETSLTPYYGAEGRTMLIAAGYSGPLIYGEMSSPRGHNPRGAWGHAEDMVKQLTWAINWRDASTSPVVGINYLVAYDAPDYESGLAGFNNQYGDPLPIVNAANVASYLLDGRNKLSGIGNLPSGVSHIRVTNSDSSYPETVVIWKTNGSGSVTLNVAGNSVKVVDLMGREVTYAVTQNQFTLPVNTRPQYIRGKFN